MELHIKVLLLAALMAASGEAIFTSRCMWKDVMRQLQQLHGGGGESASASGSSSGSAEHWPWGSRVRRFLWTDGDVCEWLCDKDDDDSLPGLPGLPAVEDICSRCCPGKTSSSPPASSTMASTTRQTTSESVSSSTAPSGNEATTTGASGDTMTVAAMTQPPANGSNVVRRNVRSTPLAPQMVGYIACHAPELRSEGEGEGASGDSPQPQARTFLGLPGVLPQTLISLSCNDCSGANTAQLYLTFCRTCCPTVMEMEAAPEAAIGT